MTIKEIKEKYKDYKRKHNEKNMFTTYDDHEYGKVVVVVNDCKGYGKTVMQAIRVCDGKELFINGECRPCDNMNDACDVTLEMLWDGDYYEKNVY